MSQEHLLSFIPLSFVSTTNDWALNSNSGEHLVGGTFTFHSNAETNSLSILDDDDMFEDDDNGDGWGDNGEPQRLGVDTIISGETYPEGIAAEAEYAITLHNPVDGSTYELVAVKLGSHVVGFAFSGEVPPFGVTFDITGNRDSYSDENGNYVAVGVPYNDLVSFPCFGAGTMIATLHGNVAVENLSEGDLVATRDASFQQIRWIGSRRLLAPTLRAHPNLRPIRIKADALGQGIPASDLIVSPQHRILIRSKVAQRMFGANEVLVAAKHLLQLDGIEIAVDMQEVEYFHFLFDDHQIVVSNGAETESLYPGSQAIKSVGPAALEEIFTIFPELRDPAIHECPAGARMFLTGSQGRKLAYRHAVNCKPLVAQSTQLAA